MNETKLREVNFTTDAFGAHYCADCGACVDSDLPAAVGLCHCEPIENEGEAST